MEDPNMYRELFTWWNFKNNNLSSFTETEEKNWKENLIMLTPCGSQCQIRLEMSLDQSMGSSKVNV